LYFAIEADEYDYMFLGLSPRVAIITNIEHDHPDCFPTQADYMAAFKSFLQRVRPDGLALICGDDPQARSLMSEMNGSSINILSYGTSQAADYRADEIRIVNGLPQFNLVYKADQSISKKLGEVRLQIPGHHNILNATAALAAIHTLGLPHKDAINALGDFTGAGRRFEISGTASGVTVIDDYGHHPTQIAATLEAARALYPDHRLWAVWEPHTFSRTQILEEEFTRALDLADRVIVLKIYAAREKNPGYSAKKIAAALPKGKADFIKEFKSAAEFLLNNLSPGDIVITFSAGDATLVSQDILAGLEKKAEKARSQRQ
jgi:UDP-N-acetylmuramate--alanine ligase